MQRVCKPGSVPWSSLPEGISGFPSFILAAHCWTAHTTYPPAWAGNPQTPVYMVFQPMGRTASRVTTGTGELLPHLFTLIPAQRPERLFSVTLPYPLGYLPVRKHGALCCPDFPFRLRDIPFTGTTERPAARQRYEKQPFNRTLHS